MKRNNASTLPSGPRSDEDQVEGTIVVNEREDDHYITTGFFDSACRDLIASPLHYLLMRELEQAAGGAGKTFSLFLAESYWGREQYLGRLGVVPYNSALFKICERVAQGTSPVSEIYHLYEDHYRHALAPGTELMGMLGNHDERRPVNTFGRDNLRPVLTLTSFLTNLLLDYEGNADGEAWKVFADNVYVDWNRSTVRRTAAWSGCSARCTHFTAATRGAAPWCRPTTSRWRRQSNRRRAVGGWRCAASPPTAPP